MNEQKTCGPGCDCGKPAVGGRGRKIAGAVILLAAGALVVRAVVKDDGNAAKPTADGGYAITPASTQAVQAAAATDAVKEIGGVAELNTLAADAAGVFLIVPGKDGMATNAPVAVVRGAAQTIEQQVGGHVAVFSLKAGCGDYNQMLNQVTVPTVLALVKGRGMSAVSGTVTDVKLVQAFVAAGSGGCGAGASSGCCPK